MGKIERKGWGRVLDRSIKEPKPHLGAYMIMTIMVLGSLLKDSIGPKPSTL